MHFDFISFVMGYVTGLTACFSAIAGMKVCEHISMRKLIGEMDKLKNKREESDGPTD
jgi:hypothetical protein